MRCRVASLGELEPGSLRRVEPEGTAICLVRLNDGGVFAIGDECSHEDIELSDGDLDGDEVMCPAHGSCFDVRTGKPSGLPATAPVPTYPVHIDGDEVFVEIGD
ncbi:MULTISPECIES: non-heme iron oxygenase ferredoxin subunit [Sporichthya]|uniref:Non-heme iron oxygenase ferredoxin subunit n=1 Tax=Sporichthya brevicatena TaxID=171442 RepID=A0ABN1GB53_9ACTN|nr:non-heme iron oxygenase ferredoxin subunit [Sporichthya polymorpha]